MEKTFEEIFEINTKPRPISTTNRTFNTLQERLTLCKNCDNRKVDLQEGLKCNLTGNPPDFVELCQHFQGQLQDNPKAKKKSKGFFGSWKGALVMSLLGFLRAATRGFEGFGLVFMLLGIVWLIVALVGDND